MTNMSPHGNSGQKPDWAMIPVDVPCPKCDTNLHGLSEPRCPECGYESTWDFLLPIDRIRCLQCEYRLYGATGGRCPECGTPIDRQEIIRRSRESSSGNFEREYRTHFVTSLIRTYYLASFKPKTLWGSLALGVQPNFFALGILLLIQAILIVFTWPVLGGAMKYVMDQAASILGQQMGFIYSWGVFAYYLPALITWYVCCFASVLGIALLSRDRYIRWPHVLRLYFYATIPATLLPLPWLFTEVIVDIGIYFLDLGYPRFPVYSVLSLIYQALFVVVIWRSLWLGFKCYFKIDYGSFLSAWCLLMGWCGFRIVYEFIL